jgi:hypothetical protein
MVENCPFCGGSLREATVICHGCRQELPLRVVVVSEGSHGGGFAVVVEKECAGIEEQEEDYGE